ncbi:hypothetical protein [Streptomyces canus]|uniref:hypothetical protein n=1 Tax=Streptomyces canus TaxID=58343 RepID=UPI0027D86486|nr:hypothetical protein [Streptomyces canus]
MDEFPLRGEVEVDGRRADSGTCRYCPNRQRVGATVFEKSIGDVEKLVPEQAAVPLGGANSGVAML